MSFQSLKAVLYIGKQTIQFCLERSDLFPTDNSSHRSILTLTQSQTIAYKRTSPVSDSQAKLIKKPASNSQLIKPSKKQGKETNENTLLTSTFLDYIEISG